ncbi:MAG: Ig-like domain-containing protein [Reinekea sp.]
MIKNTSCLAFAIALTACVSAPDPVDNPDKSSPTAKDDSFAVATFERMPEGKEINILANDDFGLDGALSWSVVIEPSLGKLAINDQGTDKVTDDTLQYIPLEGMTGADSFTYKIVDGGGRSEAEATVNITISKLTNVTLSFTEAGKVQVDFGLNATVADSYFTLLVKADGQSEYVEVVGAEKIATDGNDFELDNLLTNYDLASGSYMLELHSSDEMLIDSKELQLKVLDADGDNVDDFHDAFPNDKTETVDSDGDGVGDNSDVFPDDASESVDTDVDGIGNNRDTDDDGDGYPDVVEIDAGTDPLNFDDAPTDMDNDGIPDISDGDIDGDNTPNNQDAFPRDATEIADTDGDGIGDNADTYPEDFDNDGVNDDQDAFPKNPDESFDNSKPVAVNDSYSITSSQSSELDVLTNDDFGADGARAISIVSMPAKGSIAVDDKGTESVSDDTLRYTPNNGVTGTDAFTYQITDNGGGSTATASVSLTFSQLENVMISEGTNPGFVKISWSVDTSQEGTYLSLLVNPDGSSGYTDVAGAEHISVSGTGIEVKTDILGYNFANGSYLLELRNKAGAVIDSETLPLDGLDTVSLIGYIKAANGEGGDVLGVSVALSADGNTMAVGARGEDGDSAGINGKDNDRAASSGAVYIFVRDDVGKWIQQAYVKASNAEYGDSFGDSVSLSADGNTLAVGAHSEGSNAIEINGDQTDNSNPSSGAVYIFVRDDGGDWTQQAYLKASDNDNSRRYFGLSLDISSDGNVLVVGASGRVYVYERSADVWTQHYFWKSIPGGNYAVAISGDGETLVFGGSGSTYVQAAARTSTAWSGRSLSIYNDIADNKYGHGPNLALSDDGDTLIVGLDGTHSGSVKPGSIKLFKRIGGAWGPGVEIITASGTGKTDYLGSSISLSADGITLAVGAYSEDSSAKGLGGDQEDNTAGDSGAVYLYKIESGVWNQQKYIKASNTESQDHFGVSLSLSADGSTLAVGAVDEDSSATGIGGDQDDNSELSSGAVYVY